MIPAGDPADALDLANPRRRDDVLLVGERGYRMIDGFALGNAPREMTGDAVTAMTLVMATSNGTGAILAADPGGPVMIGAVVNFTAAADRAWRAFEDAGELIILCAGHDHRFALEDAYTAGRFAKAVLPPGAGRDDESNDGAIAARELVRHFGDRWRRAVGASAAARCLKALRLTEDIVAATAVDTFDIVPTHADRQVRVDPQE